MPGPVWLLLAFLAPGFAGPLAGQAPLAYRLQVDDRFWAEWDYLKVEKVRFNLQKVDMMEGTRVVSRFTVLEVRPGGGVLLEQQIALVKHRTTMSAIPALAPQLQGTVVRITLDSAMKVVRMDGMETLIARLAGTREGPRAQAIQSALEGQLRLWLTDLLHVAPNRAVKRGDTWRQPAEYNLAGIGCLQQEKLYTVQEMATGRALRQVGLTVRSTLVADPGSKASPSFKDRGPDLEGADIRSVLDLDPVGGRLVKCETRGRLELSGAGSMNGAPVDSWSESAWVATTRLHDHDPLAAPAAAAAASKPVPVAGLAKQQTNSLGMTLVLIPAGQFTMGTPATDAFCDPWEEAHEVEIRRHFYLGAHEVTVGQFRKFAEETGHRTPAEEGGGTCGFNKAAARVERGPQYSWKNPGWDQTDEHPVVDLSWHDAKAFCAWLSKKEGKTYRLPTEAEWEYACRAGTTTRYASGDDPETLAKIGNVTDAAARKFFPQWQTIQADDGHAFTAPVGSYRPNAWGLYDMHGNALEWCEDWFWYPALGDRTDPQGPPLGCQRVQRGGSWADFPTQCTSAHRGHFQPENCCVSSGFRVVLAIHEQAAASPLPEPTAARKTWVGRRVLPRGPKLRISVSRASIPPEQDEVFTVLEEKEGLLHIRQHGLDGWLVKGDVIPIDEALALFDTLIEADPNDANALQLRAAVRKDRGDLQASLKDLSEAIRLRPEGIGMYSCRASLHLLMKNDALALADYDEAIRRGPPSAVFYCKRAAFRLRARDWDGALADFDMATRIEPRWHLPYDGRGEAHRGKGEFARAIADCTEAIRREPGQPNAYRHRALAYLALREYEKALADFNEVLRLVPGNPLARRDRGLALFTIKDLDGAIADFDEALNSFTDDAHLCLARAWAWYAKEDYDRAVADATDAVRLDPKSVEALGLRAEAHAANKDYGQAVADFTAVLRLAPGHAAARVGRAQAHVARGKYQRARADYAAALRLDPQLVRAHNGLAWLLATCPDAKYRDGKKAVRAARRACELTGGQQGWCLDTLGAALAEAGQFHAAYRCQRQALLDPTVESLYGENSRARLGLYKKRLPYREEP